MSETNTTAHSAGPWSIGEQEHESGEVEITSNGRPYICMVLPGAIDGITEANARLIAAAPELLAALTKMAERITYYAELKEGEIPNIEDWAYTYNSGDMAAARAAIAKATGAPA